jgi:hypothetical protein
VHFSHYMFRPRLAAIFRWFTNTKNIQDSHHIFNGSVDKRATGCITTRVHYSCRVSSIVGCRVYMGGDQQQWRLLALLMNVCPQDTTKHPNTSQVTCLGNYSPTREIGCRVAKRKGQLEHQQRGTLHLQFQTSARVASPLSPVSPAPKFKHGLTRKLAAHEPNLK